MPFHLADICLGCSSHSMQKAICLGILMQSGDVYESNKLQVPADGHSIDQGR